MGTIGNSDKCQWNQKSMWHNRDSNPDLPLQKPVVLRTVPRIPPLISIFSAKEGISRLFVQNFCLTLPKRFVGESFCVSKKLSYRKFSCIRGGASRFCWIFFCVTVPKKIVREHFNVSENFGYRKISCIRRGYDFSFEFFCLTVPKKLVGEPCCVSTAFWYRNLSCLGGGSRCCQFFV